MHRVYNSAFMNMLKNEDNANYRSVMKNTLEFKPEILKRFVNFMNNPDEDTAVAQFGKDGKYFGVAIIMSTMRACRCSVNGQVEGLRKNTAWSIAGHIGTRNPNNGWSTATSARFFRCSANVISSPRSRIFTCTTCSPRRHVVEDVFAYSNRSGDERSLVVYHNKWATCRGWIRTSVGYNGKTGRGEERTFMRKCSATRSR